MLSTENAKILSKRFLAELKSSGYNPKEAILFGSYASGKNSEYSDIDLAIWDEKFTGCLSVDCKPLLKLLVKYQLLELHSYSLDDTADTNPFIGEIHKNGINILPT